MQKVIYLLLIFLGFLLGNLSFINKDNNKITEIVDTRTLTIQVRYWYRIGNKIKIQFQNKEYLYESEFNFLTNISYKGEKLSIKKLESILINNNCQFILGFREGVLLEAILISF